MADIAGVDHLLDRPDRLLDRHIRVQAGRPVDVDVVGVEPLQGVRERGLDRRGPGVIAEPCARGVALGAELDADSDVFAVDAPERVADQQLVVAHAVEVAGVEERDAGVERRPDRRDTLVAVGRAVQVGHAHAAQPDRGNHRSGLA
jgi:hypothetical protein